MRLKFGLFLLAAGAALGQAPVNPLEAEPETVVGIVDGANVTAAELQFVVATAPQQLQETLRKNPQEILRYYGFSRKLASLAEEAKIDQASPIRERLKAARTQILAEAQLNSAYANIMVLPEEQRKYYESHRDRYAWAKVKVIYISYMANPPKQTDPKAKKILGEPEARARAEKVAADVRAGADFVKQVKQHSEHAESAAKGGDFGLIRGSDNYPEEVKKEVLSAQAGQIAGPIRLGNGFYLFRVEERDQDSYEKVKDQIYNDLKEQRWSEWMGKVRSSVDLKLP